MQAKSARPFWSGAFDFRPQSSESLSAHRIPMSGASLCTRHTYRVPRTDVRQHRNSIQPLLFLLFHMLFHMFFQKSECANTSDLRVLKLQFCTKPKRGNSVQLQAGFARCGVCQRLCLWNLRAFCKKLDQKLLFCSNAHVPRAETKSFQQAKARNSVQLQAGAVGEKRAGSACQALLSLTDLLFSLIENKVIQISGRFKPRAAALRNLHTFPVFQARCLGFGIFFQEYLLLCKKVLPYSMQRKEQIYLVLHFYFKFNAHLSALLRRVRLPDGGSDTGFACCSTAAAAPDGSGRSDKT